MHVLEDIEYANPTVYHAINLVRRYISSPTGLTEHAIEQADATVGDAMDYLLEHGDDSTALYTDEVVAYIGIERFSKSTSLTSRQRLFVQRNLSTLRCGLLALVQPLVRKRRGKAAAVPGAQLKVILQLALKEPVANDEPVVGVFLLGRELRYRAHWLRVAPDRPPLSQPVVPSTKMWTAVFLKSQATRRQIRLPISPPTQNRTRN